MKISPAYKTHHLMIVGLAGEALFLYVLAECGV